MKQVIIIRKDLKMRRGKEIAQGSHASMMFLAQNAMNDKPISNEERMWIANGMKKVCLQVDSEEELLSVHHAAFNQGLKTFLIHDSGYTEFHGQVTKTAVAIGPAEDSLIDLVTGNLKLY